MDTALENPGQRQRLTLSACMPVVLDNGEAGKTALLRCCHLSTDGRTSERLALAASAIGCFVSVQ